MVFCLMIKLKISCVIVIVSSSAPSISSALIPLLSADSPFLRLPIAIISSFLVNSGCVCFAHRLEYYRQHSHKCFLVLLHCPSRIFFHRSHLNIDLCRISRIRGQCLFLVASMFPVLFLMCVMKYFFFSCCLNTCDRYYSFGFFKNLLYFLMSFGSFVVPDFPV